MKTIPSKTDEIRNVLEAKRQLLWFIPEFKKLYDTADEYGDREMYNFDLDRFENDDDYRAEITKEFENYNSVAQLFNGYVDLWIKSLK